MNPEHTIHAAQYFTATIHEWRNVLSEEGWVMQCAGRLLLFISKTLFWWDK